MSEHAAVQMHVLCCDVLRIFPQHHDPTRWPAKVHAWLRTAGLATAKSDGAKK